MINMTEVLKKFEGKRVYTSNMGRMFLQVEGKLDYIEGRHQNFEISDKGYLILAFSSDDVREVFQGNGVTNEAIIFFKDELFVP